MMPVGCMSCACPADCPAVSNYGGQVELLEQRPSMNVTSWNVLQRNGLLHLKDDAFAVAQALVGHLALELVEIVPCPPLAQAEKPNQRDGNADDGGDHH